MSDTRSSAASSTSTRYSRWLLFLGAREEQVFLVLTLVIGALVGLIVVVLIVVSERLMGYLLYRYFPEARGSGVPQTKAALYAREGRITLTTVLGKFLCTTISLACGIPLGREGPSVQIGGGIASFLGRKLGLRPEKVKSLIPVGAAAAIAAAFNTPLAAVLFTLEEVVGDLHAPVLGSVVLASATSWGVLRLLLGNEPLFQVPQYQLVSPWELVSYAVLGIAGGVVSAAFTQLLLKSREWFLRLPRRTVWFQPLAGGLLVGLMGWFLPEVLGVGYKYVGDALNGSLTLKLMVLLLVMKLIASAISYGSGNAGGIFGPSLFLGAMLGGALGSASRHFFPGATAEPGAYALVGMGTAFAGVIRAPMTSVVMIFEITRDYAVIVPLMISNLVSYFIASRIQQKPVYEVIAEQDGIHLPKFSRADGIQRQVARIMKPVSEVLRGDESLESALERVRHFAQRTWLVCDQRGLIGLLTLPELESAIAEGRSGTLADLVPTGDFPHVHTDHSLEVALERMGAARVDILPVVSRANIHDLLGILRLEDVLEFYGLKESVSRPG
jgi:chloride channel protein, CIC family